MPEEKKIIGIVGSPNKDGRTNELVTAALEGCRKAGVETEIIQMSDHVVGTCRDCLPWICKDELKCTYKDEAFEFFSEKLLNCGGLVFGAPVYWWDTTAMVKYLILKMFRVYARTAPLNGVPAFGIGVAGGTGNGLASGLRPLYHFLQMMWMRPLEPVPATRFNFEVCIEHSRELGGELAGMSRSISPFKRREESLELYDKLPYLGLSRAEERRVLADMVIMALPEADRQGAAAGLAQADLLLVQGRSLESAAKVSEVYDQAVKKYESKV
ncbi:MAG: flavodoxin family protein [Spirochaetales bacterium]|nr:flavodoxin family protein [Spirochaetales bacterium]